MSFITQKGQGAPLALQANGAFQYSSDANLASLVGSRYDLSDGREVILVSVASTGNATAGQLFQDPALISGHQNATIGTFTAYSNNGNVPASAVITLGASAMTANQYQGGFCVVNKGTGIGQTLRIASNTAAVSSGTQGTITFEDGANVALAANDRICLIPAHGSNVIISPTTASNIPAGVALYTIPAGNYGFLTSKGIVSCLSDSTAPAVGQEIAASTTTAGDIGLATATGATVVGYAVNTSVSAEARAVFIDI